MFPSNKLLLEVTSKFSSNTKKENLVLLKELDKYSKSLKLNRAFRIDNNIFIKNYLYKNLFYLIKNNRKKNFLSLLKNLIDTEFKSFSHKGKKITFFRNHKLLQSDINQAYHPDIENFYLKKTKNININYIKNINNALIFLNLNAKKFSMFFLKTISNIVPIDISSLDVNKNISFSSRNISSTIFFSGKNVILICESIIHETTHNFLFMIEKFENLYVNENKKIKTSLRTDKRPISGFFHQLIVLHNLSNFYEILLNNQSDKLILKNKKNILKRKRLMDKDFKYSLKIYKKNKNLLSDKAINLLKIHNIK